MSRWRFLRPPARPSGVAGTIGADQGSSEVTPEWQVQTGVIEGTAAITDLRLYALRTAGEVRANPDVLRTLIGWLFHHKITVNDLETEAERRRVAAIDEQLAAVEADLGNIRQKKTELQSRITDREQKLEQKVAQHSAIRAGDGTLVEPHGLGDRVSFFVAAGILVVLTIYLFLFYVSAIYNAFVFNAVNAAEEGLRTGSQLSSTVFNGQAFQKAWASGAMTFIFLSTAPSIVIGLGFLIHHFWKARRRALVAGIVGVTFFFDLLLAYQIVNQIYNIKVLTGEVKEVWSLHALFSAPEFYIILVAGFMVYLMWGLILQVVLEGVEKFNPERLALRAAREAMRDLEKQIDELRENLRGASIDETKISGEVNVLLEKRSSKEAHANAFKRQLDELMRGWLTYITSAYPDDHNERTAEAQRVKQETVSILLA